jgi:hypothetical protein
VGTTGRHSTVHLSHQKETNRICFTETNRICLVLFGMQNRTFGSYMAAMNRIHIPVVWLAPRSDIRTPRSQV